MKLIRWRLKTSTDETYDVVRFGDQTWWLHGPIGPGQPVRGQGFWRIACPHPWPPRPGACVSFRSLEGAGFERVAAPQPAMVGAMVVAEADVFIMLFGPQVAQEHMPHVSGATACAPRTIADA
jgi:hypothetical protein